MIGKVELKEKERKRNFYVRVKERKQRKKENGKERGRVRAN